MLSQAEIDHYHRSTARWGESSCQRLGITDHSVRTLYLMRGIDQSGQNDFRIRH